MISLTKELLIKHDKEGPRYTSYPTAPVWTHDFTAKHYEQALDTIHQHPEPLSLYIHIPFCQKRCLYCACNVVIRKSAPAVGDEYLSYLEKEMKLIRKHIPTPPSIEQLHIGGGTPTFLSDTQLSTLCKYLETYFDMSQIKEKSIEIDPRSVTKERLHHLYTLGFNRLSFGIQDFDETVQRVIARHQPFSTVQHLFQEARAIGFTSINTDLIYGLPSQTLSGFKHTIDQVIALKPDRIALYSFAHVPWLHSHQKCLDESTFPTPEKKIELFLHARNHFLQHGYAAIAMDHFALDSDELAIAYAQNKLKRTFMGYTTLSTRYYLGLGVSSIGYLSDQFIQHTKDLKAYYAALDNHTLPVEKGLILTQKDRIHQWVISSLMCQFSIDIPLFNTTFNTSFNTYFKEALPFLDQCKNDGLIEVNDTHIVATELGRLFIRNVCMGFDSYLPQKKDKNQFSKTI